MFYQLQILTNKGKLARVWLAAHYDKKITKTQILSTDLLQIIEDILDPKDGVKLSLRLRGFLLLGVARIYQRKATYLLKDCTEALMNMKSAFRLAEAREEVSNVAALHSITLRQPETEPMDMDINLLNLPTEFLIEVEEGANQADITEITYEAYDDDGTLLHTDQFPTELDTLDGQMMDVDDNFDVPQDMDFGGGDTMRGDGQFDNSFMDSRVSISGLGHDANAPTLFGLRNSDLEQAITRLRTQRGQRIVAVRRDKVSTLSHKVMKRHIEDVDAIVNWQRDFVPRTKRQKLLEDEAQEDIQASFTRPNLPIYDSLFSRIANSILKATSSKVLDEEEERDSVGGDVFREEEHHEPEFEDYGAIADIPIQDYPDIDTSIDYGPKFDSEMYSQESPEKSIFTEEDTQRVAKEHKRTKAMQEFLRTEFEESEELTFQEVMKGKSRSTIAKAFFECLLLKKHDKLEMNQQSAYEDIILSKGDKFDEQRQTSIVARIVP